MQGPADLASLNGTTAFAPEPKTVRSRNGFPGSDLQACFSPDTLNHFRRDCLRSQAAPAEQKKPPAGQGAGGRWEVQRHDCGTTGSAGSRMAPAVIRFGIQVSGSKQRRSIRGWTVPSRAARTPCGEEQQNGSATGPAEGKPMGRKGYRTDLPCAGAPKTRDARGSAVPHFAGIVGIFSPYGLILQCGTGS